ncbi:TPA: hypothetical protein QEM85_004244 [Pseudomonas putida]|uniref:hypothetical protein n=1 Tax=Pseudomonas putida TaxID=303 RepID=UPI00110C944A|nr:hypothetical protein [Pseudomonas putida]MDD1995643.1 hypothetical protein [Pseudomonas putida]HDS0919983.1 hypothetical protein [Pseudomonas putida]HDS0935222.1 hypothetical protein [Pseudomonas putida]HDS1785680.1 hypothetical protein [Pseudomonas putida]HDS3800833.1 hypothetical protein [Pseudomonas putida]
MSFTIPKPRGSSSGWAHRSGQLSLSVLITNRKNTIADHKNLSLTAILQIAGCPLLGSMCTGLIILSSPIDSLDPAMDGSRAIGMFNCSDDDWQLGKDSGLLTFDRGPSAQSLLLYFRHFDGGYRLYLRSGEHLGEGVFTNANGLITVQPITASDPSLWSIIDAQTGQPFDLTQCEGPDCDIKLTSADGHPVEAHYLYPVGAFLACYASAHQSDLSLIIQEREVDWLNAD